MLKRQYDIVVNIQARTEFFWLPPNGVDAHGWWLFSLSQYLECNCCLPALLPLHLLLFNSHACRGTSR